MTQVPVHQVYVAISEVMGKLAREGIAKDRKNEQQGYKFRGIDDVYNALAPHLAEAKLIILPKVVSRDVVERRSRTDTALFYITVAVEFNFVSAVDGSGHTVVTYGEAMDSGDKATNKAMSAAFKYACMQTFCIPTEGDNDADAATHVVAAKEPQPEKLTAQLDPKLIAKIEGAESLPVLRSIWDGMSQTDREAHHAKMTERKLFLMARDDVRAAQP